MNEFGGGGEMSGSTGAGSAPTAKSMEAMPSVDSVEATSAQPESFESAPASDGVDESAPLDVSPAVIEAEVNRQDEILIEQAEENVDRAFNGEDLVPLSVPEAQAEEPGADGGEKVGPEQTEATQEEQPEAKDAEAAAEGSREPVVNEGEEPAAEKVEPQAEESLEQEPDQTADAAQENFDNLEADQEQNLGVEDQEKEGLGQKDEVDIAFEKMLDSVPEQWLTPDQKEQVKKIFPTLKALMLEMMKAAKDGEMKFEEDSEDSEQKTGWKKEMAKALGEIPGAFLNDIKDLMVAMVEAAADATRKSLGLEKTSDQAQEEKRERENHDEAITKAVKAIRSAEKILAASGTALDNAKRGQLQSGIKAVRSALGQDDVKSIKKTTMELLEVIRNVGQTAPADEQAPANKEKQSVDAEAAEDKNKQEQLADAETEHQATEGSTESGQQ
jgi:hypothetical protein